jgi:hypothetical protein
MESGPSKIADVYGATSSLVKQVWRIQGFLYRQPCVVARWWQDAVFLVGTVTRLKTKNNSRGSHQNGSEGWNGMRSKREAVRPRRTRGAEGC